MEKIQSDGKGDDLGNILENNLSEPKITRLTEIESMSKMFDEQWEMLNNAIQQNTQLYVQDAKLMKTNQEYRRESIRWEEMNSQIFDLTHPEQYYAGVKEHDYFVDTLRSNFQSHEHLYPLRDTDSLKYAVSILRT